MNFFQVRQYTKFPFKNSKIDKLVQSFETLSRAEKFSIEYNAEKVRGMDGNIKRFRTIKYPWGKESSPFHYLRRNNDAYYVCEVENPEF